MSYNISLSNGEPLTTVADGTVDVSYTSINLIGKNFSGYGQLQNENFVYLLENFANAAQPVNPITGQLWYDVGNGVMKVRTANSTWKVISSATAGPNSPPNPVIGDQWWDTSNEQLLNWSGLEWKLVGPLWSAAEGTTGAVPDTLRDSTGIDRVVIKFYVNDIVTAIWSKENAPYIVNSSSIVAGFGNPQTVNPGLTLANLGTYNVGPYTGLQRNIVWGTTENSLKLNNVGASNYSRLDLTSLQSFAGTIAFNATTAMLVGGHVEVVNDNFYDLGSQNYKLRSVFATTFHGTATSARYADLAERFEADMEYAPGTVVALGGAKEITKVNEDLSDDVFGVVSTRAAYLMNSAAGSDQTHPPIAVSGRVPVNVIGKIKKGDRLVSAGNGLARSASKKEITPWNVIGRALASKLDTGVGTVEAIVKLSS